MIDRDHSLSISKQADLLGMSRSSVYYLPRPSLFNYLSGLDCSN